MANGIQLTRRGVVTAAVGGGAVAAAVAAPNVTQSLAEFAQSFDEAFESPYGNLEHGDHNSWAAQRGKTFTTASGHQLEVLSVLLFVPFGKRIPGVSRTRAFAVDFQLTGGGGLEVDTIQTVQDPKNNPMDLYLSAVGEKPGRVRAMFN